MGSRVRRGLEFQLGFEGHVGRLRAGCDCLSGLLVEYSWGRARRDGYGFFAGLLWCSSNYLVFGICYRLEGLWVLRLF